MRRFNIFLISRSLFFDLLDITIKYQILSQIVIGGDRRT